MNFFQLPSNQLPDGVDGVIALAYMCNNAKYLASSNVFPNQIKAWGAVEDSCLQDDPQVSNYIFQNAFKTDASNIFILERQNVNSSCDKVLCVEVKSVGRDHVSILYSDFRPFFAMMVQSGSYTILKTYSSVLKHFKDLRDAEAEFNSI